MPRVLPVQSRNQWFQRVEALLRNRNKRHRESRFVVEGVRSLDRLATHAEWAIEAYLYAPARPLSRWAHETLDASRAEVHLELAPELMDEVSDKDEPSELMAVVRIPDDDPARLGGGNGGARGLWVVLDRPSLPGNLGAVIRSCDALGVDGVVVFGHAADLYDPQTVRAATGSLFSVPAIRLAAWEALEEWLAELGGRPGGVQVLGTTAHDGDWPEWRDLTGPTVLVFGSETDGMSYRMAELCHGSLRIPMMGSASSLNLACAVTAILYETGRQRRGGAGVEPSGGGGG